jgi:hypothetical protein
MRRIYEGDSGMVADCRRQIALAAVGVWPEVEFVSLLKSPLVQSPILANDVSRKPEEVSLAAAWA